MFHRQDMHATLLQTATSEQGQGPACTVVVDHVCKSVDYENGEVTFTNGKTIRADLIVGADGIRVSLFVFIHLRNTVLNPEDSPS
jgi:salicylate hydroxylase